MIIAARNAEDTIARAIRSALADEVVAEVVVVDDASEDATGVAAKNSDDGTGRLRVIRSDINIGPSAARNIGISITCSPYIAILDADDFFLPNRLIRLQALFSDCDVVSDNVVFLQPIAAEDFCTDSSRLDASVEFIDLTGFVLGNLRRRGVRRELGYLQPVLSRSFMKQAGVCYDESLWLGEDYDLYVRLLSAGARFKLTRAVGYAAVTRPASLSSRHETKHLAALYAACQRHTGCRTLTARERQVMDAHAREIEARLLLRAFLDEKEKHGVASALRYALVAPRRIWPLFRSIVEAKLASGGRHLRVYAGRNVMPPQRYLLPPG